MSYETFDPIGAGWKLLTGYSPRQVFQVAEEVSEIGTVKSTLISERGLFRFESLHFATSSEDAYHYWQSFMARHGGRAGRFYFAITSEKVYTPDLAPTLEAVAGGSQAERTITARYAWKNSAGTTKASPTSSLVVPANELVKVTVDPYPGTVTQCVIYAAEDDAGAEQQQTILTNVRTWTQPDAALLLATADPPTTNTATWTPLVRIADGQDPTPTRDRGTWYDVTVTFEEVYTQ